MNVKEFNAALSGLKRNDYIVYHIGFLWVDRVHREAVNALGHAAWVAYVHGDCVLWQRRVSPGVWDYLAVKT